MIRRGFDDLQRLLQTYAVLVSVSVALVLIFLHLFWPDRFGIDATSVALVALILVVPYLRLIRRIRFGEVEAEIAPREVTEIEEKIRGAEEQNKATGKTGTLAVAYADVVDLVERDPVLALAKLRINLESALRRVAEFHDFPSSRPASALALAQYLARLEIIDKDTFSALRGVLQVANKAVHGAEITREDAARVIESGVVLLRHVDSLGIREPESVEEIERSEEDAYCTARYEVTTIVPLVDKPERKVYHLTQEQLNAMLEGYNEYAEYLVAIRPIEAEDSPSSANPPA